MAKQRYEEMLSVFKQSGLVVFRHSILQHSLLFSRNLQNSYLS